MSAESVTRRRALGVGGLATMGVVAGCGAAPSAPSDTTAAGESSGAGAVLVKVADVPVGGAVRATDGGRPVIVARPTAGTVVAFSAICTHLGCTVAPAGNRLDCPCHGSVFDAFTGKNLSGPAPRPLAAVVVHVAAGQVLTGSG